MFCFAVARPRCCGLPTLCCFIGGARWWKKQRKWSCELQGYIRVSVHSLKRSWIRLFNCAVCLGIMVVVGWLIKNSHHTFVQSAVIYLIRVVLEWLFDDLSCNKNKIKCLLRNSRLLSKFYCICWFFYTKLKLLKLIKTMLDVIIDELIKVIVIMNCLQAPM